MEKVLSELTKEELWRLFPIILCEYKDIWRENYFAEKAIIEHAIGSQSIVSINHIGSTAVPNMIAKPTIDILLEIKEDVDISKFISKMRAIGYIYSEQPKNPAPHMMFMKGYTPTGFKGQVFHVHIRFSGDWDELYFRDYLLKYPEIAEEYGKLKIELQKKYKHDRDGYTDAKTAFIKGITKLAREKM